MKDSNFPNNGSRSMKVHIRTFELGVTPELFPTSRSFYLCTRMVLLECWLQSFFDHLQSVAETNHTLSFLIKLSLRSM